jgi:glycosyltransferase involved in cell wall biosynthesis
MSKKILIFSTAYLPQIGGAEIAVKQITDRLPEFEFDLITARLTSGLKSFERIGRVNIYRIGWGISWLDKLILAALGHRLALKLHQKKQYDLAWAIMASYGGFAALKFHKVSGVKFLLTLQEGDFTKKTERKVALFKKDFRQIFSRAAGLQSISGYLKNWGEKMGFRGEISEVIPNGVDLPLFTKEYPAGEINALRRSFGFAEDSIILVTTSRLVKKNGLEDVIRALPGLPEKFVFYIVGDGRLENKLKKLSADLGLTNRVKFAGSKPYADLPKILKASDIFIRPSLTEGLGNSFLEAMAAGLPIIGTLAGGIKDFLIDGRTGLVCEPKNSASIVLAVEKLMALAGNQRESIKQNSLNLIREKYDWNIIAKKMSELFNQLTV